MEKSCKQISQISEKPVGVQSKNNPKFWLAEIKFVIRTVPDRLRDFSLSASNGERAGVRCRSLAPPIGNANYAWVQHFIHHLAPVGNLKPIAKKLDTIT